MQPIKDDILIFPPNLIYVSRTLTSEGYDAYFVIDKSAGPMWHKSLWQSIPSYHRGVDYYNHVFSKY